MRVKFDGFESAVKFYNLEITNEYDKYTRPYCPKSCKLIHKKIDYQCEMCLKLQKEKS